MNAKPKTAPAKKKPLASKMTSKSIEDHINAFLEAGGEIQHIKAGASGQQSMVHPKPVALEKKPSET